MRCRCVAVHNTAAKRAIRAASGESAATATDKKVVGQIDRGPGNQQIQHGRKGGEQERDGIGRDGEGRRVSDVIGRAGGELLFIHKAHAAARSD